MCCALPAAFLSFLPPHSSLILSPSCCSILHRTACVAATYFFSSHSFFLPPVPQLLLADVAPAAGHPPGRRYNSSQPHASSVSAPPCCLATSASVPSLCSASALPRRALGRCATGSRSRAAALPPRLGHHVPLLVLPASRVQAPSVAARPPSSLAAAASCATAGGTPSVPWLQRAMTAPMLLPLPERPRLDACR